MRNQHKAVVSLIACTLAALNGVAKADSSTSVQSQIDTLTQQFSSLQQQYNSLQQQLSTLQVKTDYLSNTVAQQAHMVTMLKEALACVSPYSNANTLVFSGCNVLIQNGMGRTDTKNGLGNLVIGYNEDEYGTQDGQNDRTGSHYLIIGPGHSYSSFGGVVAGYGNFALAPFASVLGGNKNRAVGIASSVGGGANNETSNEYATISGGYFNKASGSYSSVSGGISNVSSGRYSAVSGGLSNVAEGEVSAVSGGSSHHVFGQFNWAAGGLFQNQ